MRRALWTLFVLLLLVVVADTVVWYVVAQRLRQGFEAWEAAQRADGWTVAGEAPRMGGWPLAATLEVPNFALAGGAADLPGGLSWRASRLVLELSPQHLQQLQIDADGAQQLRVGRGKSITLNGNPMRLLVPLQATQDAQPLTLEASQVQGSPADNPRDSFTITQLHADWVLHPGAAARQPLVSVSATAADVSLPARFDWALGQRIASVAVDGAVNGPVANSPDLMANAAAWRDGGGDMDVRRLDMTWGPMGLHGSAELRLDQALQPSGTGTAEISGYAETLDALARHGVMPRTAAVTAGAILSLIATTPGNGGPSRVEVPLSLQNGTLSMQQVPLLRVPTLDWQAH